MKKKNKGLLILSLVFVIIGFIIMKLEPAAHGFGPWALIVAPTIILSGYLLGFVSIFHGAIHFDKHWWKDPYLTWGWIVFLIALVVYTITLEETASLWDCSEFIACAYKLQVPHAPGAPLFLMIGRIFSLLSFGDANSANSIGLP